AARRPHQFRPDERTEHEQAVVARQATDQQQGQPEDGERERGPVGNRGGEQAQQRPGRGEPAGVAFRVEGAEAIEQAGRRHAIKPGMSGIEYVGHRAAGTPIGREPSPDRGTAARFRFSRYTRSPIDPTYPTYRNALATASAPTSGAWQA